MQIKQALRFILPLAVFIVILAISAIFCSALFWFPSTSQTGSQALTVTMLKYAGIGFALLAVLFGMGVGLDALFSRIQNTASRRTAAWVAYPGLILVCICLPLAFVGYTNLQGAAGGDTGWRILPALPDAPAKISSAGIAEVIVQSATGDHYSCKTAFPSNCWAPAEAPSNPFIENYIGQMESAPPPGVNPPGELVSLVGVSFNQGGTMTITYYAILKDDSIWYLTRSPNAPGTSAFATGFLLMLFVPFFGAVFLLLLGAGTSALSRRLSNASPAIDAQNYGQN